MQIEIDIVSVINGKLRGLSPAETKVARLILGDLFFTANGSIAEIAQAADVSEATITRFAKVVDCQNVRELKTRIAQSLAVGQRFVCDVPTDVPNSDYITSIYENIKATLDVNATLISQKKLKRASELITKARQILVFGVGGGSTVMAQEIQHRLFRLGYFCNAHSDPMLMRMAASTLEKNDLIICLSLGGYSPDVLASAEIDVHYNNAIISITQDDTPLANIATVV